MASAAAPDGGTSARAASLVIHWLLPPAACHVDADGELPWMGHAGALLVQPLAQRPTGDFAGEHAGDHLDTGVGEPRGTTGRVRIRICDGVGHGRNTRCYKRIHARRVCTWWLQGSRVITAVLYPRPAPPLVAMPPPRHAAHRAARFRPPRRFGLAVHDDRPDRRIAGTALDQVGLVDGQPHGGLETHSVRCLDAGLPAQRLDRGGRASAL